MRRRHSLTAAALAVGLALTGQVATADEGTPSPPATPATATSASTSSSPQVTEATNQPPVAVDDTAVVTAGNAVVVDVLANDTDDGVGRPEEEPAHLEVVAATGPDSRVGFDADSVTFRSQSDDQGDFTLDYTISDGELQGQGQVLVTVKAPATRSITIGMAKDVVALRSYRIHGKVSPLSPPAYQVRVQRLENGRWSTYKVDRTLTARGRYSVGFSTNRLGVQRFRAVADWRNDKHARSERIGRSVRGVADVHVSGPLTRRQVRWSWRAGCPVPPSGLRKVTINRISYRNRVARGSIVMRASAVSDLVTVLRSSFNQRFPIKTLKPADAFYAGGNRTPTQSDLAAMRAGNTSAFNCRPVTGNPYRISQHSYGNAVDINTIENPYVVGSRVYPSFARSYLDRSHYRKGMILSGGVVASTMRRLGWPWGARWSHPDYQHFSANGG